MKWPNDQSLFAILVQNMYNFDSTKYRTDKTEWAAHPDRTAGRKKNKKTDAILDKVRTKKI